MIDEYVDPVGMRSILEQDGGERAIAAFLRDHPAIPYWTFCPLSGHDRYVFAEFPLGSQYKADFVLLNSYSGVWEVFFLELEPVGDPVFTRKRTPSERLAIAIRQVDDWRAYIDQNREAVRRELVRWAKTRDLLEYSTRAEPSNYSRNRLADPETFIKFEYRIIIGRSSHLDDNTRGLAGRYGLGHGAEIVTYDRLLDLAERRYGRRGPDNPPHTDHAV